MFPGQFQPPMFPVPGPGPFGAGPLWGYADSIPVGAILPFAGALGDANSRADYQTPIDRWGWTHCDGRSLSVSSYPELFAVLGYRYGGSDENFNLPDYRGLFMRGVDDGSGRDPDAGERKNSQGQSSTEVGSLQDHALQTHEHIYKAAPSQAAPAPPVGSSGSPAAQPTLTEQGPTSSLTPPGEVKVSKKETRPSNIYVYFIIKYSYLSRRLQHEGQQ